MKKSQVVDLNESIRQTTDLIRHENVGNRIQFDLKLSSKSPRVLAPPAELAQAILHVVTNAVEAISRVRSTGTIQITSAVIRDHVLVSVIDDSSAKETGSNLHLSWSRNVIKEIGGDMWVSSGVSGRTLTIDLPSASLN
jgi:two-component system, sporulation sensor kinase E